jgi:hypothetical protein
MPRRRQWLPYAALAASLAKTRGNLAIRDLPGFQNLDPVFQSTLACVQPSLRSEWDARSGLVKSPLLGERNGMVGPAPGPTPVTLILERLRSGASALMSEPP